ncbi:MAG: S8 family serine peptidase [Leptolyngbyaceae bacterium]|nr:S8 family serine peptidase [Leptolyngbyaceae bacterium]
MPGKVLTEGDRAMRSDQARFHHNVDGTGVTIGIISDSFDALGKADADIRQGELPGQRNPNRYLSAVQVLRDDPTGSDEGRAMAQIIHDVAPGAALLFYAPRSVLDFALGIDELVEAGADIIVDDLGFSEQPFFQDGPVSQAVSRAVQRGVTYISAAGNYGHASYESEFRASGQTFTVSGATFEAHDFDPGIATDIFQSITIPGFSDFDIAFNWSEPFRSFGLGAGATNDIDLFLMTQPRVPVSFQDFALVAASLNTNIGGDPQEFLFVSNRSFRETEYYLVIGKQQGISNAPNPELIKWIDFENVGTEYEYVNEFLGQSENGTVYGHPNAEGAIAVGAVQFDRTPAFGETIITPRLFTSLGGTPILFDTRGQELRNPVIRDKPQLIGPDGVSTSVLDFETFPGTSAAAPHIAAVVALMLERAGKRRLSPDDIRDILLKSTLDVGTPGFDRITGSGFIQANLAVMNVAPTLVVAEGQTRLTGTARADNLIGSPTNDRLIGRGGFDVLMGLRGHDQLKGNGGNDWLQGAAGRDVLNGNRGNDTLSGGNGRDRLLGKGGNDHLVGDRGNDHLTGGGGRDLLWGKGGGDRLSGQGGGDRFVLEQAPGVDIITDYQDGRDQFVLADELTFEELTFRSRGSHTLVRVGRSTLARINDLRPEQLTVDDVIDFALPAEPV